MKYRPSTIRVMRTALLLLTALCVCAPSVQAQDDPDKDRMFDQPQPEDGGSTGDDRGATTASTQPKALEISDAPYLLPLYGYSIYFVHKDGLAPNEAALRITFPLSVTGCFNLIPPEATSKIVGPRIEIAISDPIIKKDEQPQYGHNTCKNNNAAIIADAVVNRDEMIAAGVKSFAIKSAIGAERYDALVDKDKIMLFTKYKDPVTNADKRIDWHDNKMLFPPYKGMKTKTPLTYWFYPEGTVILSVPQAKPKQDFSAEIIKAGQARGLVRLETFIKDFKNPSGDKNKIYFVDQLGSLAGTLERQRAESFGAITVSETFYGPDGPYERPKQLEIMAKIPGLME